MSTKRGKQERTTVRKGTASGASAAPINTQNFLSVLDHLYEQRKELDKQVKKLDDQSLRINRQSLRTDLSILTMQRKFVTALVKSISSKDSKLKVRKPYVKRQDNDITLIEAIHLAMIPNKKMKMKEILGLIKKNKFYRTRSKKLYTMVNNKMREDPKIATHSSHPEEIPRGVFVYKYRSSSKKSNVRDEQGRFLSRIAVA